MPILPEMRFACFALDGPIVRERGLLPFQASDGLAVHSTSPVELDDMWRSWLGSIQARKFESSQFFVLLLEPLANGGSFHTRAREILHSYHYGLLLQGAGYSNESLLIVGRTPGGKLVVDSLQVIRRRAYVPHSRPTRITAEVLGRASSLSKAIREIHLPERRFVRLRRGLAAWITGIHSDAAEMRLHNSIRAVEAVSQPVRRGVTQAFLNCGALHIGERHRNISTLKQLYALRSCIEHIKLWKGELSRPKGFSVDDAFLFRTLQAEMLASYIYSRIFQNPGLLSRMGTDKTMERFWRSSLSDLRTRWGGELDLRRAAIDRFLTGLVARH
jgi:hypothetical protein